MKEYAELISAIAAVLWPILAFTVLLTFKNQIRELIGRLRRGKLLGQEIELSASLEKLEQSAVAVAREVALLPAPGEPIAPEETKDTDHIRTILHEAARSPKVALILLASEIEREARQLLASVGHLKGQRYVPLAQAMEVLSRQFGGLPGHISNSLQFF